MRTLRHRLSSVLLALAALLALACGGDTPGSLEAGTDFSITVASSQLKAAPGTTAFTGLQFTWVGCPPRDLALEVLGAPAGVTPDFSANPAAEASELRLRVAPGAATGIFPVVLRASSGSLVHTKPLQLTVDAQAPGFTLAVNPAALVLDATRPGSAAVTAQRTGGYTGPITFAVEAPAGFTATLAAPNPPTGGDARTLTVASGAVPPGPATVRVTATGQGLSASQDVAVTVLAVPVISAFTATPPAILRGGTAQLQATYQGGTGSLPGLGPLASGASLAVSPVATTTYTLTVANALGTTATATATVSVAPVTVTVTPGSTTLAPGQTVELTASVAGAVDTRVAWSGNVAASGATATFTAPALPGAYTVTATSLADPAQSGSALITVTGPVAQLSAAKGTVVIGQGTTLTPVFAGGSAVLSQNLGPLVSGVPLPTGPIYTDTTFVLTVTGPTGAVATASTTVRAVPAPVAGLSASSLLVPVGGNATLYPIFAHGEPLLAPLGLTSFASGDPVDSGPLAAHTTFTLTVTGPSGDVATASLTVQVVAPPVITVFALTGPDTVTAEFSGSADGLARLYDHTDPAAPVLLGTLASGQSHASAPPAPEAYKLVVTNAAGVSAVAYASAITVTIDQGGAWTMPGRTATAAPAQVFTATVAGSGAGVTWTLPGSPESGEVDAATGLYQAPSRPGTFTLTARSKADPTKSDTLAVTVVPILVWPAGQTVGLNHKLILRHIVLGLADTGVTWSLDPSTPAGSVYGSVTPTGVYLSPAAVPPADPIVVATSTANPSLRATAPVRVSNAINGGGRIRTLPLGTPPSQITSFSFAAAPRVAHTLTTLANGQVLLAGGEDPNVLSSLPRSAYLYRTSDATFHLNPTLMLQGRKWGTATLLHDGSVLLAGGQDAGGNPLATAERFVPQGALGGTFRPTAGSMARPRSYHTATLLPDGRVLLVGGLSGLPATYEATAELYDPATDTFTPLLSGLRSPRAWHRAARLLDGRVLVAGGSTDGLPTVPTMSREADLFNPATGLFTAAADVGWKVMNPALDVAPNGFVILAGGMIADTGVFPSSMFQTYNPASNAWIPNAPFTPPYPSMSATRSQPMGMMLSDDTFLVWGGNGGAGDSVNFWVPGGVALDAVVNLPGGLPAYTPFTEGSQGRMVMMLSGKVLVAGWDTVNLFTFRAVTIP